MSRQSARRYRLSRWTFFSAAIVAIFPLVGLAMVASGASIGDRIFGAVLLALGLAFVIRWTRFGVVLVDQVASFFNVLTRARHGVTITVSNRHNEVGMIYAAHTPGDLWSRLRSGRAKVADAPRRVRFPLCQDSETHAPLITQYRLSVLLPKPGCFTIEVNPVGSKTHYRATVRVLVPNC